MSVPEDGRRVPRTLVAMADGTNAPCTKAGMHWRHENAARVCALIAKLRSAA